MIKIIGLIMTICIVCMLYSVFFNYLHFVNHNGYIRIAQKNYIKCLIIHTLLSKTVKVKHYYVPFIQSGYICGFPPVIHRIFKSINK